MAYEAAPDYQEAYNAAIARLRADKTRSRRELAQDVATRGVRTSGVASLAAEPTERRYAEAETGLAGNFALEQARTGIEDRRRGEDYAHQLALARLGFDLQGDLARTLGRRQMQSQIAAGLISGTLGGIMRRGA